MTTPLDPVERAERQITRHHQRKAEKQQRDPRTCPYANGGFCADCPDAEGLPCVQAGGYSYCYNVTAIDGTHEKANRGRYTTLQCLCDCSCKYPPSKERAAAFRVWEERQRRTNGHTRPKRRRSCERSVIHVPPEQCDWLREEYEVQGRGTRDIGAEMELSSAAVCHRLRACGIQTRPRGGRRPKLQEETA